MSQPKRDKYSTNHNIKYGYVRLGIYYEARLGKPPQIHQVNLCDLHFQKVLVGNSIMEGYYSGAKKSISQTFARSRRTLKEEEKLLATGEIDDRNRLSNGGRTVLLLNKTTTDYECWLFGPLKFWDVTVGSLLLKMSGLQIPVMWTRTRGPDEDNLHWLEFPKGFGASRGRCTLWGSYYTGIDRGLGQGRFLDDDDMRVLLQQRKHVFPIDSTKRYTWKVEAHSGNLTFNEVLEQRDTTKHTVYDRSAL